MHCYRSGVSTHCDDCFDCGWEYVGNWLGKSIQEFQWKCIVVSRRAWSLIIVSFGFAFGFKLNAERSNDYVTYSRGPASKIIVKFCIAVSCGITGAIFTFPGLRMARMHWDSLKYCRESKILQIILNISFLLPFIIVILWIKPISRENLTNRKFAGMDHPL